MWLSVWCSAVWCSAANTHLKLLDRRVSGARFLTLRFFECGISHRRSVAVLCMLYKIRCIPMHPLDGALPVTYVPVRISRVLSPHIGILKRLVTAEPRSTAGSLFPSQCPSGSIFLTLYSMVWDWRVSRAGSMLSYFPQLLNPRTSYTVFPFIDLLSVYKLVYMWCWGL